MLLNRNTDKKKKVCFMPSKTEEKQMQIYLPLEQSLLHGPVQSVCSRTEKAATTESGVCRVFDRAPVAESNRK